jgi:hypothetical protein
MRLVTFGILAAMLGAGCALQTGEPGEPSGSSAELTTTQAAPKVRNATAAAGAASGTAPNPEPSPWFPTDPNSVGLDEQPIANPEPSPWIPVDRGGTGGTSTGEGEGTTSGNSGSTSNQPRHLGSR